MDDMYLSKYLLQQENVYRIPTGVDGVDYHRIFLRPGVLKLWSSGWKIVKFQCTCIFKTQTQALLSVPRSHQAPYHFHFQIQIKIILRYALLLTLATFDKCCLCVKEIKLYCQWLMYIHCEDLRFHTQSRHCTHSRLVCWPLSPSSLPVMPKSLQILPPHRRV